MHSYKKTVHINTAMWNTTPLQTKGTRTSSDSVECMTNWVEFAWECTADETPSDSVFTRKKAGLSHKPQGDYRSVFPIPRKKF